MKTTPDEIKQRILKILHRIGRPAGATQVAELLRGWGVELSERSIRLYLLDLDREGLTQLQSRRAGRVLSARGRAEAEKGEDEPGLTGFLSGRMDDLICRMGFNLRGGMGTLVVNTTLVSARDEAAALDIVRPVFASRLGMGTRLLVLRTGAVYDPARAAAVPRGKIALITICSVSLNGILLKEGVPVTSRFGGLLEFRDRAPARFVELLEYRGTTRDPLELFIRSKMTSVRACVETGNGLAGASFREFPSVALPAVLKVHDQLRLLGLDGIVTVGVPNQPLYGVPVGEGRTGLVVLGGLNPAAALEEAGVRSEIFPLAGLLEYEKLPEYRHMNMCVRRWE